MLPTILAQLLSSGLGLTANAVLARGTEWLKETTGIELDLTSQSQKLTPEQLTTIKQQELENELELRKMYIDEQKLDLQAVQLVADVQEKENVGVTERWKSDMASDSWLSKNVRPSVLLYLLTTYTVFAVLSAFNVNVNQNYVELLAQWGMIVMTAYFGGRSAEKIASMVSTWKEKRDGTR